jgi:hypothetical protein
MRNTNKIFIWKWKGVNGKFLLKLILNSQTQIAIKLVKIFPAFYEIPVFIAFLHISAIGP